MKKSSKTLKIMLIVLVIVLLSIISFVGIYDKNGNKTIREYKLGANLEGIIQIKYTPSSIENDESNSQEESFDSSEESDIEEKQESHEAKETSLIEENYIKSKQIIQDRLDALKLSDYEIRLNNQTGDIYISLADDSNLDSVKEVISYVGKFQMKDSETDDILLDNGDIQSAKVGYGTSNSSSSGANVYLTINFNKEGKKKLLDISNKYVKTTDEEGNEVEKKVSLLIEDEEVINTSFTEPLDSGMIQLTLGSATTDTSELQEYIQQGSKIATVLDNGKLPLKYTADNEEFIKSDISMKNIMIVIYILIGIAVLDIIYLIIKYKKNGMLSACSYIASIAILLLLIRYTNTIIVIESVVALFSLIILNHYLYTRILNKIGNSTDEENIKNAFKEVYKSSIDLLIVLLIIAVVFVYGTITSINSIGMILFWGIISTGVSSFLFGRTLLLSNAKK